MDSIPIKWLWMETYCLYFFHHNFVILIKQALFTLPQGAWPVQQTPTVSTWYNLFPKTCWTVSVCPCDACRFSTRSKWVAVFDRSQCVGDVGGSDYFWVSAGILPLSTSYQSCIFTVYFYQWQRPHFCLPIALDCVMLEVICTFIGMFLCYTRTNTNALYYYPSFLNIPSLKIGLFNLITIKLSNRYFSS